MPLPWYRPAPAPVGVFKDQPLPEARANWISRATFHWIGGIMKVGYSRELDAEGDLMTLLSR